MKMKASTEKTFELTDVEVSLAVKQYVLRQPGNRNLKGCGSVVDFHAGDDPSATITFTIETSDEAEPKTE